VLAPAPLINHRSRKRRTKAHPGGRLHRIPTTDASARCRGPAKMSVQPPTCRCPCRLSRLLVGGLAVVTDSLGGGEIFPGAGDGPLAGSHRGGCQVPPDYRHTVSVSSSSETHVTCTSEETSSAVRPEAPEVEQSQRGGRPEEGTGSGYAASRSGVRRLLA
jgi:hypothetical protein